MFGSKQSITFDPEDVGYIALLISIKYKRSSSKSLKLVQNCENVCKLYEKVRKLKGN